MLVNEQQPLNFPKRPGWPKAGPGRPRSPNAKVLHRSRGCIDQREPLHVTMRVNKDVPNLRTGRFIRAFRQTLAFCSARAGFRVVHYSVQSNHVHCLIEADNADTLGRGDEKLWITLRQSREPSVRAVREGDERELPPASVENRPPRRWTHSAPARGSMAGRTWCLILQTVSGRWPHQRCGSSPPAGAGTVWFESARCRAAQLPEGRYSPVNFASRFSRKADTPSPKSEVAPAMSCMLDSICSCCSNEFCQVDQ